MARGAEPDQHRHDPAGHAGALRRPLVEAEWLPASSFCERVRRPRRRLTGRAGVRRAFVRAPTYGRENPPPRTPARSIERRGRIASPWTSCPRPTRPPCHRPARAAAGLGGARPARRPRRGGPQGLRRTRRRTRRRRPRRRHRRHPRRPLHRHHGPVRLGQEHADALPRRARLAHVRARCTSATSTSARCPTRELTRVRRERIGFVFQAFNLLPTLDTWENITLPLRLAGRKPDQRVGRRRRRAPSGSATA